MGTRRRELLNLVERVQKGDYANEVEGDALVNELMEQFLDPQITDYIFWPDREMTAEEIVDRALAYRPLIGEWKDDDQQ